jgi:ribosome-associated toxin RatA of RatAB toxin-antitoxin module
MKELRATSSIEVAAPVERCFELLSALEEYPSWYPEVVRSVQVLERESDGRAVQALAMLHASLGPIARDFDLRLAIETERPTLVRLSRIPHDRSDPERFEVTWRLREAAKTWIGLELEAKLSVPRLVPVGGLGDTLAGGFTAAAARRLS